MNWRWTCAGTGFPVAESVTCTSYVHVCPSFGWWLSAVSRTCSVFFAAGGAAVVAGDEEPPPPPQAASTSTNGSSANARVTLRS